MNNISKSITKLLILFSIGGMGYTIIEMIWRGKSHISMFILGGVCFLIIGGLNESSLTKDMPLFYQMTASSLIITILELITGLIVNVALNLSIWDYSDLPFNIAGQICLPYSILWFFLSLLAIILDDFIRYLLFKEDKIYYKLF